MASYAAFSPGRNWEQIRTAICLSKANVKIINSHAGLSASGDGATHQSLEDIALLRVLPGMTVLVPCDSNEAKQAVLKAARFKGPVSIRLSRDETPVMTTPDSKFEIGKAEVVKEGEAVTIIACGPILFEVLKAWKELNEKHNIRVEVINSPTIKPLDKETIITSAKKTKLVITVEEHQVFGGLGSAVAEVLGEELPTKIIRMGVKDKFGESGKYLELLKKHGLDYEAIVKQVLNIVSTH
jgi:transketolase